MKSIFRSIIEFCKVTLVIFAVYSLSARAASFVSIQMMHRNADQYNRCIEKNEDDCDIHTYNAIWWYDVYLTIDDYTNLKVVIKVHPKELDNYEDYLDELDRDI